MDADRARELLAAERARIERALPRLRHQDDSEPADEFDPANLASDLYQDELDEGGAPVPGEPGGARAPRGADGGGGARPRRVTMGNRRSVQRHHRICGGE